MFALPDDTDIIRVPVADREIPPGAIFISYARADSKPAFRLVEALRKSNCLIWLDHERLDAGDNFENHLEDAVKKDCSLFISVISTTTESRAESYYCHRLIEATPSYGTAEWPAKHEWAETEAKPLGEAIAETLKRSPELKATSH